MLLFTGSKTGEENLLLMALNCLVDTLEFTHGVYLEFCKQLLLVEVSLAFNLSEKLVTLVE